MSSIDHVFDQEDALLMKRATIFSVSVAIILVLIKIYAWLMTGSVSMMSSLIDSFLDVVVSVFNFMAVRYALQPPDEEHRFGHNSAEDVAALMQAAFIAGSAIFISFAAVEHFINPQNIENSNLGIAVMLISIVLTACLVIYQKHVVRKTKSTVISADSLHYFSDLLMNMGVVIAIILVSEFNFYYADPIFAIIVALYIIYGAWKIGRIAFDKLMDKEFPAEEKSALVELILSHKDALGVHDLKTRYSGAKSFIQFHLELDGAQSLNSAHAIADALEIKIQEKYKSVEVIIHQDPQGFAR